MKKLNKSFTVTFKGVIKKGKNDGFREILITISASFLEKQPFRLEESGDLKEINLYFMNDAGEWALVAGTADPNWEELTKKQKKKEFPDFRKQIRKIYDEICGSREN